MDNTVKIWDIKPFSIDGKRELSTFDGAPHGFEKNLIRPCWSPDGDFIACGSGDRSVVVWSIAKHRIVYKLPGIFFVNQATRDVLMKWIGVALFLRLVAAITTCSSVY